MRKKTILLTLLTLLAATLPLSAQKISVTGQVTDIFGNAPLPGAPSSRKTEATIQSLTLTGNIPYPSLLTRHWCSHASECRNRPLR